MLFEQAVAGVVGEAVGGVVLVDQGGQAQGTVVLVAHQAAQGVGDGDQVAGFVVGVAGVFAGAVLVALDLGQGVPPQVLGPLMGVDDGVGQAVGAVEVFGGVAFGVGLGQQVALVVVAGLPGAAVGVGDCGDQWGGRGGPTTVFKHPAASLNKGQNRTNS